MELFQIKINHTNWDGVLYSNQVSKYVPEDQCFVIKQNDYKYWLVSGRKLTQEETLNVIGQYHLEQWKNKEIHHLELKREAVEFTDLESNRP